METLTGSQVFHAFSAAFTFLVAVSSVNGGTGALNGSAMLAEKRAGDATDSATKQLAPL